MWTGIATMLGELAPKGLYARALIIIIAPIVLLESVVAFAFMERHWNQVTRRLSEATARDMAAVVDLYKAGAYTDESRLAELAHDQVRAVADRHGARQAAADAAQAVFRSARPGAVGGDQHAREAAVLDRYGRATCGTWKSGSTSTTPSCASPRRAL